MIKRHMTGMCLFNCVISCLSDIVSEIEEEERKRAIVACSQAIDKSEYAHNRNEMKRTSFWLPEFTPEGGAKIIQKVSSVRVRAVGAACDLDVFGVDCSPLNAPRARTPDGR